MASTPTLCMHGPSSSLPRWTYDVFLSFRGEDTRKNFTDHLYAALIRTGIIVFRDDERLERGKEIGPELLSAIEHSRLAVVVISPNYASSTWCLKELVKILQCNKEMSLKVLPIFYGVDPSVVRKQKRSFEEAFAKNEKDNAREVESWRRAMKQLGTLSGFPSQNRHENELIKEVVRTIWDELSHTFPTVTKGLVGMDSHMTKMNELFGEGLDDVRLIGICGMGGIGKSTIARVYYDRVRCQFQGSCLINVKEVFERHGALGLQEQLLSQILRESNVKIWDTQSGTYEIKKRLQHIKMFVILDNMDSIKQLEVLAVEVDWFPLGSRIIVTSRDRHLLRILRDDRVYDLAGLNDDDALTLFRMKAFKQDQPITDYMYEDLSRRVVDYAKGLPLALEVLGSCLHGKSAAVWEDSIARLSKLPRREIHDVLRVSYDGLEELVKKIFLDIACFFKGETKDQVTRILNCCGFHAIAGLNDLTDKSLITIDPWNRVQMHDLLQAMGREIVRLESPEEPGRRSRLWVKDDVCQVLVKDRGGEQVEGIFLELAKSEEPKWNIEAFSKLKILRLLKIDVVDPTEAPTYLPVKNLVEAPIYLSDELRILHWCGYPWKSLSTNFYPDQLCELKLCHSRLQQLWDGIKVLKELRIMDLSHSEYLIKTPDFTGIPNLEELILRGCTSLKSVDSSITGLKYLRTLDLNGCCKLVNVPDHLEELEGLEELDMGGTAIRQVPVSISCLKNLKELCLRGVNGESPNLVKKHLSKLIGKYFPSSLKNPFGLVLPSLRGLSSLNSLDLSHCNLGEGSLPSDLGCLASLKCLNLSYCNLGEGALPGGIGSLASLINLKLDGNEFVSLPTSLNRLSNLWILSLEDCKMLRSLSNIYAPDLFLELKGCDCLQEMPDPSTRCRILGGPKVLCSDQQIIHPPLPCFEISPPNSLQQKWKLGL